MYYIFIYRGSNILICDAIKYDALFYQQFAWNIYSYINVSFYIELQLRFPDVANRDALFYRVAATQNVAMTPCSSTGNYRCNYADRRTAAVSRFLLRSLWSFHELPDGDVT